MTSADLVLKDEALTAQMCAIENCKKQFCKKRKREDVFATKPVNREIAVLVSEECANGVVEFLANACGMSPEAISLRKIDARWFSISLITSRTIADVCAIVRKANGVLASTTVVSGPCLSCLVR